MCQMGGLKKIVIDKILLEDFVQANEELKLFAEIEGFVWACFFFSSDLINRSPDTLLGTFM